MTARSESKIVDATFDVTDWQEEPYDEPSEGPRMTRVRITKRYHGPIEGTGITNVLTAQGETGSGYVASERVDGTLDGRAGTFVIQHGGLADGAELSTYGTIIPGSGTGDLVNLRGRATEGTEGVLRLEYTLDSDETESVD